MQVNLLNIPLMLFSSYIRRTILYSSSTQVAAFSSVSDAMALRLGLPLKPKKPLPTFLRFFLDTYPTLKLSSIKMQDRANSIGVLWKQLDDQTRQNYQKVYEKEIEQYKQQLKIYESKVTNKQRILLQHEELKAKEEKTLRSYYKEKKEEHKRRLHESGKPKQPLSAFLLFCSAERAKSSDKLKIIDLTKKWENLTDHEKKPFRNQSSASWDVYKVSLKNWKKNVLRNGPPDLL